MSDPYMDEISEEIEREYQQAMEEALNICLRCDLFSLHEQEKGEAVGCRMQDNPMGCGGPYRRISS